MTAHVWLDPGPNSLGIEAVSLDRAEVVYARGEVLPIRAMLDANGQPCRNGRHVHVVEVYPDAASLHRIRVDRITPSPLPS